jgi:formylmethanofuran dehydrogenase subunit C
MKRTLHFLGYRLPYGKSLRIEGDTGNFTGSALQGGDITVTGASGDWTGAGMTEGKISIHKNCGRNTGEWMQGGEIWVENRIRGLGRITSGQIYQAGEPVVDSLMA